MSKPKVINISGHAQHGKDTVATMLGETLVADGYKILIVHYADLLKYICKTFFHWDGEKDWYGRSLLQRIGTDIIRQQSADFFVGFVSDMLCFFDGEWDYVIIPDTRFPNEIEKMREKFDVIHVRVERSNFVNTLTREQRKHPSETALDDVEPDYRIANDGTLSDLKDKVFTFVERSLYGKDL